MPLSLVVQRATLLIVSGPAHDPNRKHLFIVLTDRRCDDDGEPCVLMASVSTVFSACDSTCLLNVGDHPFVKHESFVNYAYTRREKVDALDRGVAQQKMQQMGLLDAAVYARVMQGFELSPHTPAPHLAFFRSAPAHRGR